MNNEQIIAGIFTNLTTFTPWIVDTIAKIVPPEATESSTKRESSTEEARKSKKSASVQKVDTDTQLVFTSTSTKAPKYICCFYRTRVRSLVMLVTDWLTNWLTNCCLVNLIDVTLTCADANLKLVDVVTVADEDRVVNNLLQISKLRFGKNAKLLFRLWAQGLVKILKLKFRQDFETRACSAFFRWCFVEVMKLNLGRYSEARLGQVFEF